MCQSKGSDKSNQFQCKVINYSHGLTSVKRDGLNLGGLLTRACKLSNKSKPTQMHVNQVRLMH